MSSTHTWFRQLLASRRIFILTMAALTVLVGSSHGCSPGVSNIATGAPKPVQAFHFYDTQGKAHTLADLPGTLKIVHFWASWCAPCVAELPDIDRLQHDDAGRGLTVIAISLDSSDIGTVQAFLKGHHIASLTPYIDSDNTVLSATRIHGLPTTLFVNAKGEEIARAQGQVDWGNRKVRAFIMDQLAKP